MNTKKAIKFIERILKIEKKRYKHNDFREVDKVISDIIELLQRGEKYKEEWEELVDLNKKTWEMWEEFKFKRGDTYCILDQPDKGTIRDDMNVFEQKYFPKKVDKPHFFEATSKNPHLKKIYFKKKVIR